MTNLQNKPIMEMIVPGSFAERLTEMLDHQADSHYAAWKGAMRVYCDLVSETRADIKRLSDQVEKLTKLIAAE